MTTSVNDLSPVMSAEKGVSDIHLLVNNSLTRRDEGYARIFLGREHETLQGEQ